MAFQDGTYRDVLNAVMQRRIRHPNDLTAAEIAAGVTPVDYAYEAGEEERYSNLAHWCAVLSRGVEGHLRRDVSTAVALDLTDDAIIIVHGRRSITATATMDYMLRTSGKLTIEASGELLFDGDGNVTYSCLHTTNNLPTLKNVRFLDAGQGWATGPDLDGEAFGVDGEGILENVIAENCENIGFSARGDQTDGQRQGVLTLINCGSRGTTGSGDFAGFGAGFLFQFSGLHSYERYGGLWEGASDAQSTDGYACDHAAVFGGWHSNVGRGVTIGLKTQMFAVVGTCASDLAANGVSADITDGVGETIGIGVLANNVVARAQRPFRTTGSHISLIGNFGYECLNQSGQVAIDGDATNVFLDGNYIYSTVNGSSYNAFAAFDNSVATHGTNYTNSISRLTHYAAETSGHKFLTESGLPRTITAADNDLRGSDRLIYADTTANATDLDLFDPTEAQITGFTFDAILMAGANNLTVTMQGAGSIITTSGTVSGVSLGPPQIGQRWRFHCIDGAAGTWVASLPGLAYIQSTSTSFNPGNLADGAGQSTNVTVTGAQLGDFARASFTDDTQGILLDAQVTAADTVTVRFQNETTGALDLASGNIRVMVWRHL